MTPIDPSSNPEFEGDELVLASDALQEILSRSALSDGAGTKVLTEPLLIWCDRYGGVIIEQMNCEFSLNTPYHVLKLFSSCGCRQRFPLFLQAARRDR